jgi:hypothetical protein
MLSASDQGEPAMNAFYEHHRDSIRFGYRCFDRILLIPANGSRPSAAGGTGAAPNEQISALADALKTEIDE